MPDGLPSEIEINAAVADSVAAAPPPLPVSLWNAGQDDFVIPPRGWLLANRFCRRFLSALLGDGGTGKTALRYAQYLSLATGKSLTGEHVFQRCRVLIVCLEDDRDEVRRRILAAMLRYGITARRSTALQRCAMRWRCS
jgi:hypothetical protein